mmetsp:Transcript_55369/g.125904  ORF Transcript_55369/g.125904 Transcript_55369/m.125904 type:complete len:238 (+) Transcript_55369:58-771(+)
MSVSTICVVGFPADAGVRERKNFLRFLPGFERAVVTKTNTLFAKFETPTDAENAVAMLATVPYDQDDSSSYPVKAELAKSEMGEGAAQVTPSPRYGKGAPRAMGFEAVPQMTQVYGADNYYSPASFAGGKGAARAAGGFAARAAPYGAADVSRKGKGMEDPNSIYTIAVLGLDKKGLTFDVVESVIGSLPGFLQHRSDAKINALFAKFDSPASARQAVEIATSQGIGAEMARRNAGF